MSREGLAGDVMVGGSLGHSDNKMRVFISWRSEERSQQNCYFGDTDLFMRLVDRVPWETVLKGRGVKEG